MAGTSNHASKHGCLKTASPLNIAGLVPMKRLTDGLLAAETKTHMSNRFAGKHAITAAGQDIRTQLLKLSCVEAPEDSSGA
jgi:hypothetical protein